MEQWEDRARYMMKGLVASGGECRARWRGCMKMNRALRVVPELEVVLLYLATAYVP